MRYDDLLTYPTSSNIISNSSEQMCYLTNGIFLVNSGEFEMYELIGTTYQRMVPNSRGHYPIPPLAVEIGVWEGAYQNQTQHWLRWWDP